MTERIVMKLIIMNETSGGYLAKYGGGGQAYCFGRMTSHISIVLEQTI